MHCAHSVLCPSSAVYINPIWHFVAMQKKREIHTWSRSRRKERNRFIAHKCYAISNGGEMTNGGAHDYAIVWMLIKNRSICTLCNDGYWMPMSAYHFFHLPPCHCKNTENVNCRILAILKLQVNFCAIFTLLFLLFQSMQSLTCSFLISPFIFCILWIDNDCMMIINFQPKRYDDEMHVNRITRLQLSSGNYIL